LHATPDQTLTLKGLRGRSVILGFYPADWSPVCGDQMDPFDPDNFKYEITVKDMS
jgi:peroxiredoxin